MSTMLSETSADSRVRPFASANRNPSSNHLLASLPAEEYQRIASHLKRVPMKAKQLVFKQDRPIESVYFPGGGACSLIKMTETGETAEVAVIGAEGVIGSSVFFGVDEAPCDVIVQLAGADAEVLPSDIFTSEMHRHGTLYNRLIRYSQALLMQIMQTTVCNSLHSATQRVARSLLLMHDRAGADEFGFTHEAIASNLGIRRPTVTLVLGSFLSEGLIEQRRGTIRIVNRTGLEDVSCECHRAISGTFNRLLPDLNLRGARSTQG